MVPVSVILPSNPVLKKIISYDALVQLTPSSSNPVLTYPLLGMMQKYVSVLQRYFVQYLCGFDVTVLKEVVQVCDDEKMVKIVNFS